MIKAFSFLLIGFLLLLALPLCIGLAGGLFGLVVGVIGAVVGLFFGFIALLFKGVAWIFGSMMDLLFGWDSDFGCHTGHWHFNGYLVAALIVLIIAISQRKK